ncbi:MAG: hypothetical protein V2A73_13940 [Pseudomonadota bacterium]
MSLVANRTEQRLVSDFPQAGEMCQGFGDMMITTEWFDDPGGRFSLLIKQIKTATDQNGNEMVRETDDWTYEGKIRGQSQFPTLHHKTIHADLYLPGVFRGGSMQLVEEQWTTYRTDIAWCDGPPSWHRVRSGYVLYDETPTGYTLSGDEVQRLRDQGYNVYDLTNLHKIPDSARSWTTCLNTRAVVRKEDAPQRAYWLDPWIVEEELVEEDFLRRLTWNMRKDYTQPGPPELTGPREERKTAQLSFQLEIQPPTIKGEAAADLGNRIEVRGGGCVLETVYPFRTKEWVGPDSYVIYRKVISEPDPPDTGDMHGIYVIDFDAPMNPGTDPVEDSSVTDFAGVAADALPPQEPDTEPDGTTPPDLDDWQVVAEVDNLEKDKKVEGRVFWYDLDVGDGGIYEYYALAVIANDASAESNHVLIGYVGTVQLTSSIVAQVHRGDRWIEVVVELPPMRVVI